MRKLTRLAAAHAGRPPRVPVLDERENVDRSASSSSPATAAWPAPSTPTSSARACGSGDRVREEGAETSFSVVGRKGVSALTFRKQDVRSSYTGFTDRPAFADAREIGEELTARYVDGEVDRVELIYNRFVSPLTQHVWRQTLLPLQQARGDRRGRRGGRGAADEPTEAEEPQARSEWDFEPEPEELLARLIPEYVTISVYRALLESAASELGARMTAMRNAAENAESIMDDLTLEMNRARQAEITQEILEVVGGAEALS